MPETLQLNPNSLHIQSVRRDRQDHRLLQQEVKDARELLASLEAREEGLAHEVLVLKEEEDRAASVAKRAIFRAKPKRANIAREVRGDVAKRRGVIEEDLQRVTENRLTALREFVHLDLQKDGQKEKEETVLSYTQQDQRDITEILHILEQLMNPKEYKILPASWSSFGYKNKLRKNWFTSILANGEFLIDQYCQDRARMTMWKSIIRKQHDLFRERLGQVYTIRQKEGKASMERSEFTKEEKKIIANTVADVQRVEYCTAQMIEYFTREIKRPPAVEAKTRVAA